MKVKDLIPILYKYEINCGNIEVCKMTAVGYKPLTDSDIICLGDKIII